MFMVHYHRQTGEIRNWGNDDGSEASFAGADYLIARFDDWQEVVPTFQRIDIATRKLIDKPAAERPRDLITELLEGLRR
jgi:hypothetical protein